MFKLAQKKILQQTQLKAEKVRLNRGIEQQSQTQATLKAEIIEKDWIILNYAQKAKGNEKLAELMIEYFVIIS